MDRRRVLQGLAATAGAVGLAGCTVRLPKTGEPSLDHSVRHESFVGEGFQPTVVVTGEVTNDGEVYIKRARVTARLADADGQTIDERSVTLERLEQEESQPFHFVFPVSAPDVSALERVDIDVSFPDRDG